MARKAMRANLKLVISGVLVISCGLITGWCLAPRSLWEKDFVEFSSRPSNTELLASALEMNSHCANNGLRKEKEWQERELLPTLSDAGQIIMTAPNQYRLREQLWLNMYGENVVSVTEFGWVETDEYLESYYITPRNYFAIAKKFKQQPTKFGENKVDIRRIVAPDGVTTIQSLHISKIKQGTRVACRELKTAR